MEDPYLVLGLRPGASQQQVRTAFKRLAFQNHPDRNPGDAAAAERFKRIFAAFEAIEGKHAFAGTAEPRRAGRSYRVVWPDPFHPEPPTVQPSDDEDLHYPTPEEIASLDAPSSFRPTRWLGVLLAALLSFALIMAYAHYLTDVPVGPSDPNVKRVLDQASYRF
jgi:hypothetical protein